MGNVTAQAEAKAAGLWCLQLPQERVGRGVGYVGMAVCYQEMSRSIFGPMVFNSAAPDDGNMMEPARSRMAISALAT